MQADCLAITQVEAVAVMGEVVYSALSRYYDTLEKLGYLPYSNTEKLLILCFYCDFLLHGYRRPVSREDYLLIERALDCLYGSTCLIPYPDYLKMGKLQLGSIIELSRRIKKIEDTSVLKLTPDNIEVDSDVAVIEDIEDSESNNNS